MTILFVFEGRGELLEWPQHKFRRWHQAQLYHRYHRGKPVQLQRKKKALLNLKITIYQGENMVP